MEQWSLQDAKNKLSEVVDRAETRPQVITRRGKNTAVVLSYQQYLLLSRPAGSLLQGLLPEEPIGVDLDVERDRDDVGRDIGL